MALNSNGQNKNNEKRKNEKDREEYGFGYDRSVEDLKVVGQNKSAKKSNDNNTQ